MGKINGSDNNSPASLEGASSISPISSAAVSDPISASPDLHTAQTLDSLRVAVSGLVERINFASQLGFDTYSGSRNLFQALGYSFNLTTQNYRERYNRGDIAETIIEYWPNETWTSVTPEIIVEDEDPSILTPFEKESRELLTRLDAIDKFRRADILAGLGEYSCLLIGINSPQAPLLSSELPRSLKSKQIVSLTPLAQDHCSIDESKLESDVTSSRWGLPTYYNLTLPDAKLSLSNRLVHWSRIIHITHKPLESDTHSKPTLQIIWNRLVDLDKIIGSIAEAIWRGKSRMHFNLDPKYTMSPDSKIDLKNKIDEMVHGLRDVLETTGMNVNMLQSSIPQVGSIIDAIEDIVSGVTRIPRRVLFGSERGELASSQDRKNKQDTLTSRRTSFGNRVLRSFVDRLTFYGALSTPISYQIIWPSEDELSEDEKANTAKTIAEANKAQTDAGGSIIVDSNEIRDSIFGLEALASTVGGEADTTGVVDDPSNLQVNSSTPKEIRAIQRISESNLTSLSSTLLTYWQSASELINTNELTTALESHNSELAVNIVERALTEALTDHISVIESKLLSSLVEGGNAAAKSLRASGSKFRAKLSHIFSANSNLSIRFDATNPRAINYAATRSSTLITEITPDTLNATRTLISSALDEGIAPRKLAQYVRENIGLRTDQINAASGLRIELLTSEPGSLITRIPPHGRLRDIAAFRARIPKSGASESWVDRQVSRYQQMSLNQRARTIARTEIQRSANEGQRELWRQSIESGDLPRGIKRTWIANTKRHAHMEDQKVGIDESFDPPIEPGEEPNCGCSQGLTL